MAVGPLDIMAIGAGRARSSLLGRRLRATGSGASLARAVLAGTLGRIRAIEAHKVPHVRDKALRSSERGGYYTTPLCPLELRDIERPFLARHYDAARPGVGVVGLSLGALERPIRAGGSGITRVGATNMGHYGGERACSARRALPRCVGAAVRPAVVSRALVF